jgi:hypothetical protein
VAGLLADALPFSVHLHSDDFWHYIRQRRIAPYLPQADRQNQVVIDALAHAAFAYAAGGYHVICDGIVGPWFIDVFRAAAAAQVIELHYVILRPDETTAVRRASAHGDQALTDPNRSAPCTASSPTSAPTKATSSIPLTYPRHRLHPPPRPDPRHPPPLTPVPLPPCSSRRPPSPARNRSNVPPGRL